ncbi:MAG: bifunctional metallophosphatase/5'-nucleotidase [Cellulosilyticaceae bacterium]
MKRIMNKVIVMMMFVLLAMPVFGAQKTELTIFHTNDTHGNVEDDGGSTIGFGKMSSYIESYKASNPNVIVLDAGDMFQGAPFANVEQGHSLVSIVNQVGYDAMAVGNHEFDYSADNLKTIEAKINYSMLAANVYKEGALAFKPYIVKEIEGVKVGIFGMATPETAYKTHPNNVAGYEFKDPIVVAKEMVATLTTEEQVDVIVMVGHMGVDEGAPTSVEIAEAVEGIDVIVDGHSHTKLEEGMMVGETLIVSTGEKFGNIGKVELVIEEGKVTTKEATLVSYEMVKEVVPNAAITEAIARVKAEQEVALAEVVGETKVDLVGEREVVRTGESNLGQLMTDAMLKETGAQIAMTNGGGIRASIPAGKITKKQLVTVFPFANTVMVKELSGADVVAALEHGVSKYPEQNGAFAHVAGITFTLDASKEAGSRVSNVKVAGKALEMDAYYTVATNDFVAVGGDGYEMFKAYPIKAEVNTLMDILLGAIEAQGVVEQTVEPRIEVVYSDLKVRDFAVREGFEVGYEAKTRMVSLTKEDLIITFVTGAKECVVDQAGTETVVAFDQAVQVKEDMNYLNKKQMDTLVSFIPAA